MIIHLNIRVMSWFHYSLQDFVYVYDGIPSFMIGSQSSSSRLLAVYCGYGFEQAHSVQATSGALTVYFEGKWCCTEPSLP